MGAAEEQSDPNQRLVFDHQDQMSLRLATSGGCVADERRRPEAGSSDPTRRTASDPRPAPGMGRVGMAITRVKTYGLALVDARTDRIIRSDDAVVLTRVGR